MTKLAAILLGSFFGAIALFMLAFNLSPYVLIFINFVFMNSSTLGQQLLTGINAFFSPVMFNYVIPSITSMSLKTYATFTVVYFAIAVVEFGCAYFVATDMD